MMGAPQIVVSRPPSAPTLPESGEQVAGAGPLRIGDRLSGDYEITGVLGRGGMGVVYDAFDHALGRRVAIKTADFAFHAEALISEARVLAAFDSPLFVRVYAMGRHEGVAYFVMERLHGDTLAQRIAEAIGRGDPLEISEVVDILASLAEALSLAHATGITQRDLKPSNVMLGRGRTVLFDFGIAVPEALVEPNAACAGTLLYLPPEVLMGSVEKGFGPMVDLYALGVVAFELLTLSHPFDGVSARESVSNRCYTKAPDVRSRRPDVPDDLAILVAELLASDPRTRPPSAEAVLWQLDELRTRNARRSARSLRVRVIDDDVHVGRALKASLEAAFPRLDVTVSIDPAIVFESDESPDIALVDLNMPGHNGVEVCMHLLGAPPTRRPFVVAMSAEAREEDVEVLRKLGVRDFIRKDESFARAMSAIIARLRGARPR